MSLSLLAPEEALLMVVGWRVVGGDIGGIGLRPGVVGWRFVPGRVV
jgi:hypothetical protein